MADFCTVADVASFLQREISDAGQVTSCERAIAEATAAIKNWCHQEIELVAGDVVAFDVGPGRRKLFLPELPVVSVASVIEDGVTLVEGAAEDYQLGDYGILYRVGAYWASGIQIVTVTYSHGYATIPDDVVGVCTRAAARAFQAGLRSADSEGVPGVQAKSLGDYSVTFGAEAGGGVSEGVLGASAARMLLLSEKDILAKYRVRGA